MCRFALYLGETITVSSLVTEPENSIIHQSFHSHEREEPLNGDGFGLAWYMPAVSEEPALFKDISPAWNNLNLLNLARLTRSSCVLAHVRAASPGLPVIQLNCHPFAWGPFAFMHNGTVAGFHQVRRTILERLSDLAFNLIRGTTDSEYIFALFADHYLRGGVVANRVEAMASALTATIAEIEEITQVAGIAEPSSLNLALSDGSAAVITRYISHTPEKANSLYVHAGRRYVCEDGLCHMLDPDHPTTGAVIVASEPLSQDSGWDRVPVNHMVLIHPDLRSEVRLIEI